MKEAKDPYKKVDTEIDRVNRSKLKAMPVSLTRSGGSLYAHILHQCIDTRIESKLILTPAPEKPADLVYSLFLLAIS